MDVFYSSDVQSLLRNKLVVIIGDSIQRAIYKDIVLLLQHNRFLKEKELKDKGEYSFLQDELIEGGRKGEMTNGVKYTEVRQYASETYLVRFYFVTRAYNSYVESIMKDLEQDPLPDIVIMNSCLWDITRYGKESIVDYKKNLVTLFDRFKEVLPNDCLVIWNTTLPISTKARGGFLIPEIEFRTTTLRLDVLEANYYVRDLVVERGFDILDLHFYLRHHIDKRVGDGVHWDMMAHRYITNLLLSHICKAFNAPSPNRRAAPFSSYPKYYNGTALFNNFDNPGFESSPIRGQPEVENRWPPSQMFQNICRNWMNVVSSVMGCMPVLSGRNPNDIDLGQGWHGLSERRPMRSHDVYGQDPYKSVRRGPYERENRQNRNGRNVPDYHYPMFHRPVNGPTFSSFPNAASNVNSYFSQPYQQNDYQGASHCTRRNRRKPYNGAY